jgi:hypothetical protein
MCWRNREGELLERNLRALIPFPGGASSADISTDDDHAGREGERHIRDASRDRS